MEKPNVSEVISVLRDIIRELRQKPNKNADILDRLEVIAGPAFSTMRDIQDYINDLEDMAIDFSRNIEELNDEIEDLKDTIEELKSSQ